MRFFIGGFVTFVFVLLCYVTYPIYLLSNGKFGIVIHKSFSFFLFLVTGTRLEVSGVEYIDKDARYLIVSNHQSIFDIPILFAVMPQNIRLFAKRELGKIPMFGTMLLMNNHVLVDRNNKRSAVRSLKKVLVVLQKFSFVIFPEGTRSIDGSVAKFKETGLTVAQKARVAVLPVAIKNSIQIEGSRRYLINPSVIKVQVFPPVSLEEIDQMDRKELCELVEGRIRDYVES